MVSNMFNIAPCSSSASVIGNWYLMLDLPVPAVPCSCPCRISVFLLPTTFWCIRFYFAIIIARAALRTIASLHLRQALHVFDTASFFVNLRVPRTIANEGRRCCEHYLNRTCCTRSPLPLFYCVHNTACFLLASPGKWKTHIGSNCGVLGLELW